MNNDYYVGETLYCNLNYPGQAGVAWEGYSNWCVCVCVSVCDSLLLLFLAAFHLLLFSLSKSLPFFCLALIKYHQLTEPKIMLSVDCLLM